MKDLHKELPEELKNEDEGIFTVGEDIASSFYYGNFSQGVEELEEAEVTTIKFLTYLEDMAEGYDMKLSELYNGHFDREFFICLGREHY